MGKLREGAVRLKRLVIVFLTLGVVFATAFASDYAARERRSIAAYQALLQSFGSTDTELASYPAYYGGAYINDEGKLVIKVRGNAMETGDMEDITAVLHQKDVEYEAAEYSYEELRAVYWTVTEYMLEGNELKIGGVSVQEQENCVSVTLPELTEEVIARFRQEVCASPAIRFKEAVQEGGLDVAYID